MELEHYSQPAIEAFARRFNVTRGQRAPVAIGGAVVEQRWGLLAPWQGHGGKRPPPIYTATLADLARLPVLKRAKHCLVLADGAYVWQRAGHGATKKLHPFWLHADGPLAFAAVTATHADDSVPAFAILVGDLAPYDHPVPLTAADAWLTSMNLAPVTWRATPVSRHFTDDANDDPQCIAPLGNPAQTSLF